MTRDEFYEGWLPEEDATCRWCSFPYRYETSDAVEYQRYCTGDCERAEERAIQVEAEELSGDR